MRLHGAILVSAACLVAGGAALAQADPDKPAANDDAGSPIEVRAWSKNPKWRGKGPMPRHNLVETWGIPAPYADLKNPLPRRAATLERGYAVYRDNCASCHGVRGAGDGEEGKGLSPPPGNLVWLSDVREKLWDAFIYWTTMEGGTALGTGMPAYKNKLSEEDVWAVSAYIQSYLPFVSQWRIK